MGTRRTRRAAALAVLTILMLAPGIAPAQAQPLAIRVLSNRADLISGGDALVAIDVPANADAAHLRIDVDGRDVASDFARRPSGAYAGVLTGLAEGANTLSARLPDGGGARLTITNHPAHGPVFAGPQVLPWFCDTENAGLGPSTAPHCEVAPVYTYNYKPQNCVPLPFPSIDTGGIAVNCLLPEYDPDNPPDDVDTTTTDQGRTVPFIVRTETGVIDRGIYRIAVLYDPSQADYTPWAPQPGFNGKVLMTFGGDCSPSHVQAQPISVLDVAALSRGFAVMSSSLNVLGHNCNDVVSAESMMMLKEHFIERYGPIRYTIGNGASGGSIQQHWLTSNYPGLLDGIQPAASFPDMWQVIIAAQDCHLLNQVFNERSPQLWANLEQRAAVSGYATPLTCPLFDNPAGLFAYARISMDPASAANCQGGPVRALVVSGDATDTSYVYNAETNPHGERCTVQDYGVAVWGRRAQDGFANRPYDNVGIQYGLEALQRGLIGADQFVDLNEQIGGIDIDWNFQVQRSEADPDALRVAYRGGRITSGRAAAQVPIIDLRGFSPAEIHTDVHSQSMRARLDKANGGHGNQIIWNGGLAMFPDPVAFADAFLLMDRWLAAIEADDSDDPKTVKVLRHKPADAVDACWIGGQKVTDAALCATVFPYFGTPRIAAGGPLTDDVLKCRLKPLRREDYAATFSDAQWQRLQAIYPDGVCDYGQPAVGEEATVPWLSYAQGPGGTALGAPPASMPLAADDDGGRFGGALDLRTLTGLLSGLCAAIARRRTRHNANAAAPSRPTAG